MQNQICGWIDKSWLPHIHRQQVTFLGFIALCNHIAKPINLSINNYLRVRIMAGNRASYVHNSRPISG